MFTQKKLDKIEQDINNSLNIADKRAGKYIAEYKGRDYLPLDIYLGTGRYVRKYPFAENGSIVVAKIEVDERKKGKGYFKSFYNLLEKIASEKSLEIVFESVLSDELNVFLKREGYSEYQKTGTFYKQYRPELNSNASVEKEEITKATTIIQRGSDNGFNR